MEISIRRETLLEPLADINSIADKKSTTAILGHVLIQASDQGLSLKGTDLEISLAVNCREVEIKAPGEITVPVSKLLEVVRHQKAESMIACRLEGEQFIVQTPESTFRLMSLPAVDFPLLAEDKGTERLQISSKSLHNLLTKVRFAMADQDPRIFLNGLYLHAVDEGRAIHAVSSDGHRLACGYGLLEQPTGADAKLILPNKAVAELIKMLGRVDETVTLEISDRQMSLLIGDYRFSTRLIDGTYARYQEVIPSRQEAPVLIPRQSLIETLQRAKVLLTDKRDGVCLAFKAHQVEISGRNSTNESFEEVIDIVNNGQIDYEIGLNVAYLLQASQNLDSESLQLHLTGNSGACLLTGQEDENFSFVIMTMRL